MRISTANVTHGMGFRSDSSADCTENLIRSVHELDADIVCLQEIDDRHPRSSNSAQMAAMHAAGGFSDGMFAPTLVGEPGPGRRWKEIDSQDFSWDFEPSSYGIAMLSRIPVLEWHRMSFRGSRLSLPMPFEIEGKLRMVPIPDEPRAALGATVECEGRTVTVVTTHLSFIPSMAVRQLRAVREWMQGLPGHVILAGDLNLSRGIVRSLSKMTVIDEVKTYPAPSPRSQLDYICVNSPTVIDEVVTSHLPAGDHLSLSATIHFSSTR